MDIDMESVGIRIKNKRKELGLTQTDIFEMYDIRSGVWSRIEKGTSVPSVILFYKIAQILNCDMNWLLTGESSNMEKRSITEYEENLLDNFRQLSKDDQEDFAEFLTIKLRRTKGEKLSHSEDQNNSGRLA